MKNIRNIKISKNNKKLAEFIGVVLGDGHIHKKDNCITVTGSIEDIHYYTYHIAPLIKNLFNIDPKIKKRNDRNSFYLYFNSKEVVNYLTEDIGLIRGNKVNARIPLLIRDNTKLIPHFLKGLFDTDGCLKFSKQTKDKHYYPRVQFCFRHARFSEEVLDCLKRMNFKVGLWKDNRSNSIVYYQISGKNNLERWIRIVNPSNPVHKTKYLIWKKYGYYVPKSSLKSRIKSLDLNMNFLTSNAAPKAP